MGVEAGQPGERFGLRPQLSAVPLAVWALVGLQLAVLLCYSVLMPVYRAPDEPQNFDIAMATRTFSEFTGDHRTIDPMVIRSYRFAGFSQRARKAPVDAQPPRARHERPSFAALDHPVTTSDTRNQQWQHPPLYPAAVGAAVTVVTSLYPPAHDWAFDRTVWLARAFSIVLVAPLPLFAFLCARRLTPNRAVALTAAVVPLTIPQLAHIGAAVSHDNLLVALVGLVTVAAAFVLRGDASVRTAVVIGVLAGLALLTKGFALVLPAWITGLYLLAAVRWRQPRFLGTGALAVVLAAGLGGWWWARNLAVHGTLQPTGVLLKRPEAGFVPDFGWWIRWFGEVMPSRFWGHLGWYQAALPRWVVAVATVVVLTAVVAAFVRRRTGGPVRADLLAMAFPLLAITAVVAYGGWGYYTQTGLALGLQGRYLYPGLTGLAVLVGTGVCALPARAARWAPPVVLTAATAMHAVAVHVILRDVYQAGTAISWPQAAVAVAAWSPWPVGVLLGGVIAVAALLGVSGWLLVAQSPGPLPPSPSDGQRPGEEALDAPVAATADGADGAGASQGLAVEEAGASP